MGWQAVTPRHDRLDKVGLLGGVLRTIKHADTGLDRFHRLYSALKARGRLQVMARLLTRLIRRLQCDLAIKWG